MTNLEIDEFIQGELSDLNLSTKEKEKYTNFLARLDYYKNKKGYTQDSSEVFMQKFNDCLDFFNLQGFDDSTSLHFAKKIILETNRRDLKEKLTFLRVLNFEESIINNDSLSFRFSLSKAHAKKMYLVAQNLPKNQTRNLIIHEGDFRFEKKYGVLLENLVNTYPITSELKEIWMIIGTMKDDEFKKYFKMTRDELSFIYPTTKDEVETIHAIALMENDEILDKYGITRQELLAKYPLNRDTLKALKSIRISSDKAIENTFNKTRKELLELRTITTDMIRIAQKEKMILKRKTYTKEELKVLLKSMKKGTNQNG